jgi:signal transduction histidine kinase
MLTILLLTITAFFFLQRKQKNRIRIIASKLDQSNQVMNKFISVLAHDLRSPFNAILGFTEILLNDDSLTEEEKKSTIARLHGVSRSTYNLLEKMLEWSRIQSGSVKPVKIECNLNELVNETVQVLESSSLLKNIAIKIHSDYPLMIHADPDMVLTVIRNLLSNAIKFTHPGGYIEIRIESNPDSVYIRIRDNGTGIPPGNLDKLFRVDQHYKSQGTAGEKGTGLGLPLCMEYINMHQGRITVESEPGVGSEFTVELPRLKH